MYQLECEDEILKKREAILAKQNHILDLSNAGLPINEVEKKIDEALDELASGFDRRFDRGEALLAHNLASGIGPNPFDTNGYDSMLAYCFKEQIREKLIELITARSKTLPCVLSTKKRDSELALSEEQLFDLECEEELLIRKAESLGLSVVRRGDARPEIVLAELED